MRLQSCPCVPAAMLPQKYVPPVWVVTIALLCSYGIITSGLFFNIIMEPPSLGQSVDPVTGTTSGRV
ncbi:hypothetical protein EON67_03065 [archaeon]|nr:MAG: hypothetical protein EON67_03065 [archaeon]